MSVALVLVAAAVAAAGSVEPWERAPLAAPPAAVLQAATAATRDARDAHVVVLHEEGQFTLEADGRVRYRYHQAYRIQRAGFDESWGRIGTGWAPWLGDRPVMRARVVLPDGTTRTLDSKTIVETPAHESSPDTYGDRRILRAPLPGVVVGTVVEVEIVSQARGPLEGAGTERRFYFGSDVPMRRVRLGIDVADGVPLHLSTHGLSGVHVQRKRDGGRERVVFEAGPLAVVDAPERDLPLDSPPTPSVAFSTGKSWQDVARRYDLVTASALRGSDFSAEARALGARGLSPLEIARRANAWLAARVRYSGLELGDATFVPRPPRETLQKGFGDCKDQAGSHPRSWPIPSRSSISTPKAPTRSGIDWPCTRRPATAAGCRPTPSARGESSASSSSRSRCRGAWRPGTGRARVTGSSGRGIRSTRGSPRRSASRACGSSPATIADASSSPPLRSPSPRWASSGRCPRWPLAGSRASAMPATARSPSGTRAWASLPRSSPRSRPCAGAARCPPRSSRSRHTLATLLAETGKPGEARELLHEQIDVRGRASDESWYTLGRIAESYGLPAVALDAYRSIAPPRAGAAADSISVLAERAIRRLAGAAASPPGRAAPPPPSQGAAR